MITSLRGTCVSASGETVVIEVGGVGLLVTCTPAALGGVKVGQECSLATAMVVREDGWTLYGFRNDDERFLFERLQTVAGVGPRLAQAAVGGLGAAELVRAIGSGDIATLTSVSGVGRKTAERVVLELREKVAEMSPSVLGDAAAAGAPGRVAAGWQQQVLEALVGLGWQQRDAESAVGRVAGEVVAEGLDTTDISGLLKRALRSLDRT